MRPIRFGAEPAVERLKIEFKKRLIPFQADAESFDS